MPQRRGAWRGPRALLLAIVSVMPAWVSAAPPRAIEVENVRVGFTAGDRNNLFKVGAWNPVWVQLKAGPERFAGVMEVIVPDDSGTATAFRQFIDVAAGSSQRYTTYARPGSVDPEFLIRLYDKRGKRRGEATGSSLAQLSSIGSEETLILTLGKPQGVELIPVLPGFNVGTNTSGKSEIVVGRIDALGGLLPGRWIGFDPAQTIVVDTNDRDVMSSLSSLRGQALVEWVRRGGHLVVGVGSNWQQARDSVLGPLLPAVPNGQERVNDLGALESFAGAAKPITPPGTKAVQVTKLEQVEERGGKVLSHTASIPLVVRGAYGFGRVTVVALDVDQRPFADWADKPLFWVRALDLRGLAAATASTPVLMGGGRRIYQVNVNDLSTQLRIALEQFPGVTLVPFGLVAFFIFIYILLIGPGDYLFLKKVVKRMELTWITFPAIVATVSLLAYFAAYAIKGNDLRVNKIDIVDVDQPAGIARGSTFMDLFSPQNRDYGVSIVPQPLDAAASPEASVAGSEVVLSWFGVPESGFGGMGGGSRLSLTSGGYAYGPPGSAEILTDVRIPIWSTKVLHGRWFGPAPAKGDMVECDLQPVGTDRLSGTVTNRLGVPWNDTILAFNKQVYLLGTIQPGQTVRVELQQDRTLAGYLASKSGNYQQRHRAYSTPKLDINRADLSLALMFHDSLAIATTEPNLASRPLHSLDLTGQLLLDRPVLVTRIDRPAARLDLTNSARVPKIDQTTMLRVILPLKAAAAESEK